MAEDQLRAFRDRFKIPVDDKDLANAPYVSLTSEQKTYLDGHRKALGGDFPVRKWRDTPNLEVPELAAFDALLKSTGEREISTTMAFVRVS